VGEGPLTAALKWVNGGKGEGVNEINVKNGKAPSTSIAGSAPMV